MFAVIDDMYNATSCSEMFAAMCFNKLLNGYVLVPSRKIPMCIER